MPWRTRTETNPQGTTLTPTSVHVTGPVNQPLTLSVAPSVPVGTYHLRVKATSGNLTKTANLTLTVSSAPSGLWTRQFGTRSWDVARGVAVDKDENIVVVGETKGALPGQRNQGGSDAFVRKYSPSGRP